MFAPNDQAFLNLTGAATEQATFDAVVALLGVDGTRHVIEPHG